MLREVSWLAMRLYEAAAARYPGNQNRCVSCGFFGKHKIDWLEVSLEERATGVLRTAEAGWFTQPACIRGAADLAEERGKNLAERQAGQSLADAERNANMAGVRESLLDVLNFDRECPEWYPYTPGFSPKEHVEQLQMMQLEADRRTHELQLAKLRAEADQRAAEAAQRSVEISTKLHEVSKETARFTTHWTYVAVALAGAALLVILANYLFPDAGPAIGRFIASHTP
jgi:hypothetical protein